MIWFLVLFYVMVTLIAYLLYTAELLTKNKRKDLSKKNVCLLIAHPDDECMFFGPILRRLRGLNNNMFVLCMTNGNFYGKGVERESELKASCFNLLGEHSLKLINEPSLPDDPKIEWNSQICLRLIDDYLSENKIDLLVTFDQMGVSSHSNHCFLNKIVRKLNQKPEMYFLKTVFLTRKYSFIFDLLPSLAYDYFLRENLIAISSLNDYLLTLKSMMKHKTQLLWFRWIYIFTSSYMVINILEKYTD
jgi:N-acetylglucosaminylphosphatidylinositol deacetylase